MHFYNPEENSVATNPNFLCSMSEINENLQNFQKIIFISNMILWRQKIQFSVLISLHKTFSPSTVNVRSKLWRFWKKRDFSKVWYFVWSSETKTASFNFDVSADNFSAKHGKCSYRVLKILKKKEIFQKFDFLFDLTRRRLQFSILISLPKSFLPSTGNVRSKFWRIWKEREVSKVLIFNWSYDKKTANLNFDFPAETFFAKHGKCSFKNLQNLKKNQIFQILFFHSKCSFGHVECSFNEPVKIFPPIFEKSFSSV